MAWSKTRKALLILVVFHTVGILGLISPYQTFFASLTPINLFLTSALLFWNQESEKKALNRFFAAALIIGFIAELLGIQTGFPFGHYSYGEALGPKLVGTPIIIGVNWFIVALGARSLAEILFNVRGFQIFGAAMLMVALDFLIEPVAMQLDYWSWEGDHIPIKNYLGWMGVGLLLQTVFFYWLPRFQNSLAIYVFFVEMAFFALLNLLL